MDLIIEDGGVTQLAVLKYLTLEDLLRRETPIVMARYLIEEAVPAMLNGSKRIFQKRIETEDQMVIEREKKRKQRAEAHSPEIKKQRKSEEANKQVQEGSSKRQKTEGRSGCKHLACSTHTCKGQAK